MCIKGCCRCVAALKPRYKRLVDNIFPTNSQDGLVKNNMDKLTFYALSSRPEKLDRIGQYLEQKLNNDVNRHRYELVFIAMEALDLLLVSCHAHSLNLFVESYLKMVQKLLESVDPGLQITATSSFVKFSNIEEDTPSYHRRYDFFVSKFSSMCHCGDKHGKLILSKIRSAGLRGLQGVVRKTASDDLQINIWESIHMDKIVPSLLFNMSDNGNTNVESPKGECDPSALAEVVFRDLVCRASYGNIRSVILPVLLHLDNHKAWVPPTFAVKCFNIVMYAVQSQYGYFVIQLLLSHLDKHVKDYPENKRSIVTVLFEAVLISTHGSIGPSVLEVFNNLLRHLKISVNNKGSNALEYAAEIKFQDTIVNTIGEFANSLPDYQKIEIMMFVMGKFSQFTEEEGGQKMDKQLQVNLLKTLLKVAAEYKTVAMSSAFPPEFLHPLLKMSLTDDAGLRITVQEILHTLIDRHGNTQKLTSVELCNDITSLDLTIEKCSRQDVIFMKKNGIQLYWHILENIQLDNNRVDNLEVIYCTMALLAVELLADDILIELLRLSLDIQCLVKTVQLPITHKCAIHSIVAAYISFLSQLLGNSSLIQYVNQVILSRQKSAPFLLPAFAFNRINQPESYPPCDPVKDEWLFDPAQLSYHLISSGLDTARINMPFTQKPYVADIAVASHSVSDLDSINFDLDCVDGSLDMDKKGVISGKDVTVESLKMMLLGDSKKHREKADCRRQELISMLRNAPFDEIVAVTRSKSNDFHKNLEEVLSVVSMTCSQESADRDTLFDENPAIGLHFPELFVH